MSLITKNWKDLRFVNSVHPEIICPACQQGMLRVIKESFKSEETAESIRLRDTDSWHEMDVNYKFSCLFKCNYINCKEIVACCGSGYTDQDDPIFDKETGTHWASYYKYYVPEFFSKPVHIIELKKNYPGSIRQALESSFRLFFSDSESCANKIRVVIENLMDERKIKKTSKTGSKRRSLSLHARIVDFSSTNKDLGEILLAIKWIGNSGSHNSGVTREDTLDAYRILEHVLNKLYDTTEKELMKIVKTINKKKGPLSKFKSRKTK